MACRAALGRGWGGGGRGSSSTSPAAAALRLAHSGTMPAPPATTWGGACTAAAPPAASTASCRLCSATSAHACASLSGAPAAPAPAPPVQRPQTSTATEPALRQRVESVDNKTAWAARTAEGVTLVCTTCARRAPLRAQAFQPHAGGALISLCIGTAHRRKEELRQVPHDDAAVRGARGHGGDGCRVCVCVAGGGRGHTHGGG